MEIPANRASHLVLNNPLAFTPSGDVYSYFVRRQVAPHSFAPPLKYELTKALGGSSRNIHFMSI